ncbi:MAG: glycosyltransferase family 2 protein [Rudaea sp.]
MNGRAPIPTYTLSIVVPVFDEEAVLPEFHRRLAAVLDALRVRAEVLYVSDGSSDNTVPLVESLRGADARVALLELSRNFGKEIAMSAGLDAARGDAVIVIDADLQDPPERIPDMVDAWRQGYDIVLMRRSDRTADAWLKRTAARAFYGAMARIGSIRIPEDVGDFRLLSRRAVEALRGFPERSRFMKGLFAWIGYPTRALEYDRAPRHAGTSKWNYWRLWNFAIEAVTSFSAVPLKVASYVGLCAALIAFVYGAYVVVKTLIFGDLVRGYPTLVTIVLLLGGLQLMALGVIGEYLARMFVEVKRRPLYLVQRRLAATGFDAAPVDAASAGAAAPHAVSAEHA